MVFIKNKKVLIAIAIVLLCVIILMIYSYQNKVTEASIIRDFNENYELFHTVEKYADETSTIIFAHKKGDRVVIRTSNQDKENQNILIRPQIEDIINKLKYESIEVEDGPALKNIITFERTSKGGVEQGIVFIKDDSGKYGMKMVKIREGWYYYLTGDV